jgi:RNA polymerase-associated protein
MLSKPNPASTTLYSAPQELESHAVRFVMAHKSIEREVLELKFDEMPEEIIELNPFQTLPTLFDRGMVLYDLSVILEYLDERFPFPPLLPVDPIEKAEKRLLLYRFTRAEGCWYELVDSVLNGNKKDADAARKTLNGNFIELLPLFAHQPYFKSDSLTLVDVCLAPILWRLNLLGITLEQKAKPLTAYANRLFEKDGFQDSLTIAEKDFNQ